MKRPASLSSARPQADLEAPRTRCVPVSRWRGGRLVRGTDSVVEEVPFVVEVNGRAVATLLCTPADLDHLGLGFLKVEGFIDSISEIRRRTLGPGVFSATLARAAPPGRGTPARPTGFPGGVTFLSTTHSGVLPGRIAGSARRFPVPAIFRRSREFLALDATHRETGGTHSAALATGGSLLRFASDIGRHSAVQKLAGWAMLNRPSLQDAFILVTGRISSEMVRYAARMGVPLIASRAASTFRAIEEADGAGITLLGFVRGGRMNAYTHPERLERPRRVGTGPRTTS